MRQHQLHKQLELPLRRATHYPCYDLASLQHVAHVEAAAYGNVSVVFIEISSQKSIRYTLSIILSKSIADDTVDVRNVAAINLSTIITTSILTKLLVKFSSNCLNFNSELNLYLLFLFTFRCVGNWCLFSFIIAVFYNYYINCNKTKIDEGVL